MNLRPAEPPAFLRLVVTMAVAVLISAFCVTASRAFESRNPGRAASRRTVKTIIVDNYQPYTFMNEKGSPDGFSVEILKAVATVMDFDLDIRADTWERATKELEQGTIDLLPMMAYSGERDKKFDFSSPHTIAYDAIFHRSGDTGLASLRDLSGKTVIVMNKDAAHDYLLSSGLSGMMRLRLVDSLPEALRQLASGKGDAAIMPKLVGIITLKKLNLSNVDSSPHVIDRYTRPFSFAVREGDQALMERLNQGLAIVKKTGQYDAIYKKWFGALEGREIPWISMLQLVSLAAVVLLAFVAWNLSLKRQVKSRTKDLEAEVAVRKQADESLRRSAAYTRSLIEASLDPLVTIDAVGKITDVNSAAENATGHPRNRLIGTDFWEYFTDPEKARTGYQRVFREGAVLGYPLEIRHRDGNVTPVLYNASVYRDESGNVLGVFAAARDISVQKQIHDALQRREEELRTILRTATDGFWITDRNGKFLEVNDAACRNLGYSRDELLRMSVSDIEIVEKAEEFLKTVRRIMDTGSAKIEGKHRRKDGALRSVEVIVKYLPPPHDRFFAFLRDITERRELEAQYLQAHKMEAVGTLAGGIAHDFNNALTGIVGFGELLRMRMAGDREALHDLDEILRCAERATTLTRQLLTFARRQVIEPVNLDLSTLVADLMKLIGKVVGEHIEVKTCLEKYVPTVHADRGQVEQVVMNLCLNARDAMPEGGRLTVEAEDVSLDEAYVRQNPYMKTGRYAVLTVSDTGIGMDENTRKRVFEPFFTTKGPDKGTGLGLSMVYGIVKQHGGFIHLYSEPGKGTAFKLYFPAVEARPDAVPAVRREEAVRGGTETILLAEDEEGIRSFIERALKELGYDVLVARNGEEALEIFRRKKEIVLAVLDVVMPRKGGKEAFGEMRKENPRLKVIFMSGYSADAIHESFVSTPGTPFLQKPFGPTVLARKIREVLDS